MRLFFNEDKKTDELFKDINSKISNMHGHIHSIDDSFKTIIKYLQEHKGFK